MPFIFTVVRSPIAHSLYYSSISSESRELFRDGSRGELDGPLSATTLACNLSVILTIFGLTSELSSIQLLTIRCVCSSRFYTFL